MYPGQAATPYIKSTMRLEGGNRGVQKCDSVDSLSLVIKCLGGGGASWGTR